VEIDFANLPTGVTVYEDDGANAVVSFGADETVPLTGVSATQLGVSIASPDGTVNGTDGADKINLAFTDAEGDSVTDSWAVSDDVEAGDGNDTITLYRGDDEADGGVGNDVIYGVKGANTLFGGIGGDTIYSGLHGSELSGGEGDDVLVAELGSGGDHSLTGGDDADRFLLAGAVDGKTSLTTITDFAVATDKLEIESVEIDFANLPTGVTVYEDDGGNAVVSFGDDETVTLTGVSATQLGVSIASPDGTVNGTDGADKINLAFTDAEGDSVSDSWAVSDDVEAGDGNDTITLYKGDDEADGGVGNDVIYGVKGANTLSGGIGDDTIYSGLHGSEISGGEGDDVLIAELRSGGDHSLTGDGDADTFVLTGAVDGKTSLTTITDLLVGTDVIDLLDVSFGNSIGQVARDDFLSNTATIDGDDLFMELGDGRSIKILDVVDVDDIGDQVEDYVEILALS
ncbi:MAG: calcium-binding protein, partial [Planctomycetaceae bacterium]|nr:calcium-binding protein [Planctomycetaceae bacterium]